MSATRTRRSAGGDGLNPATLFLLPITRLKEELLKRNLETHGNCHELALRLQDHLQLSGCFKSTYDPSAQQQQSKPRRGVKRKADREDAENEEQQPAAGEAEDGTVHHNIPAAAAKPKLPFKVNWAAAKPSIQDELPAEPTEEQTPTAAAEVETPFGNEVAAAVEAAKQAVHEVTKPKPKTPTGATTAKLTPTSPPELMKVSPPMRKKTKKDSSPPHLMLQQKPEEEGGGKEERRKKAATMAAKMMMQKPSSPQGKKLKPPPTSSTATGATTATTTLEELTKIVVGAPGGSSAVSTATTTPGISPVEAATTKVPPPKPSPSAAAPKEPWPGAEQGEEDDEEARRKRKEEKRLRNEKRRRLWEEQEKRFAAKDKEAKKAEKKPATSEQAAAAAASKPKEGGATGTHQHGTTGGLLSMMKPKQHKVAVAGMGFSSEQMKQREKLKPLKIPSSGPGAVPKVKTPLVHQQHHKVPSSKPGTPAVATTTPKASIAGVASSATITTPSGLDILDAIMDKQQQLHAKTRKCRASGSTDSAAAAVGAPGSAAVGEGGAAEAGAPEAEEDEEVDELLQLELAKRQKRRLSGMLPLLPGTPMSGTPAVSGAHKLTSTTAVPKPVNVSGGEQRRLSSSDGALKMTSSAKTALATTKKHSPIPIAAAATAAAAPSAVTATGPLTVEERLQQLQQRHRPGFKLPPPPPPPPPRKEDHQQHHQARREEDTRSPQAPPVFPMQQQHELPPSFAGGRPPFTHPLIVDTRDPLGLTLVGPDTPPPPPSAVRPSPIPHGHGVPTTTTATTAAMNAATILPQPSSGGGPPRHLVLPPPPPPPRKVGGMPAAAITTTGTLETITSMATAGTATISAETADEQMAAAADDEIPVFPVETTTTTLLACKADVGVHVEEKEKEEAADEEKAVADATAELVAAVAGDEEESLDRVKHLHISHPAVTHAHGEQQQEEEDDIMEEMFRVQMEEDEEEEREKEERALQKEDEVEVKDPRQRKIVRFKDVEEDAEKGGEDDGRIGRKEEEEEEQMMVEEGGGKKDEDKKRTEEEEESGEESDDEESDDEDEEEEEEDDDEEEEDEESEREEGEIVGTAKGKGKEGEEEEEGAEEAAVEEVPEELRALLKDPKALLHKASDVLRKKFGPDSKEQEPHAHYEQVPLTAEEMKLEEDEEYRQLPDPDQFHGEPVPDDMDDDLFEIAAGLPPRNKKKDREPQPMEEEPLPDEEQIELDFYNSDLNMKASASNKWLIEPDNADGFALMWGAVRSNYGVVVPEQRDDMPPVAFQVKIAELLSLKHLPFEESDPHDIRVGWSRAGTSNMLGESPQSFAFNSMANKATANHFIDYGEPFGLGDVITTVLDINCGEIRYFKNGSQALGPAFTDIQFQTGDVYFPHVATKNCKLLVHFGVERPEPAVPVPPMSASEEEHSGQQQNGHQEQQPEQDLWSMPSDEVPEGTQWIGKMNLRAMEPSRRPISDKAHCTIIVMVGLSGVGKTTWVRQYLKEHPDENWVLLNTDTVLQAMSFNGVPRRRVHQGRWDMIMGLTAKALNRSLQMACRRRHNYILDQSNVSREARKRKLTQFQDFQRKCVCIIPSEAEHERRLIRQAREQGGMGQMPAEAMLEMKGNFAIPSPENEPIEEVIFIEPPLERVNEAIEQVRRYNDEGKPWVRQQQHNRHRGPPQSIISDHSNLPFVGVTRIGV